MLFFVLEYLKLFLLYFHFNMSSEVWFLRQDQFQTEKLDIKYK